MKKIFMMVAALAVANIATAKKDKTEKPTPNMASQAIFLPENQYKDYIAVPPIDFDQLVAVFNPETNKYDTQFVSQLKFTKSRILSFLSDESTANTIEQTSLDGSIKYGPASVTAEEGRYVINMDYAKFTTLKIVKESTKCSGLAKVGIGLRIKIDVTTFQPGIDVSSLKQIKIAAVEHKLSGQVSVDVIGMSAHRITDLINMPFDIATDSIQSLITVFTAMKDKIYDDSTTLTPQLLAIKSLDGTCKIYELLQSINPEATLRDGASHLVQKVSHKEDDLVQRQEQQIKDLTAQVQAQQTQLQAQSQALEARRRRSSQPQASADGQAH
jgi:hypothetical protein